VAYDSANIGIAFQHTLKTAIPCTGVGLHSGNRVSMTIAPAPADNGITFVRTDKCGAEAEIQGAFDNVRDTRLCTVVGNAAGTTIGTVEHLMAALWGCGIDNAVVELDGPEVPIMDGSADPFVFLIDCAGRVEQDATRRAIRILKTITVGEGGKVASLRPDDQPVFSFEIDFDSAVVARQSAEMTLTEDAFKTHIARARTFGFLHEVEALRNAGLARGGSLDNAIVVSGDRVLNEGGLRFADEFVRHKILDAVGDLYLAGAPILGRFHGCRSGHMLNNQLLRALFNDRTAWCYDTPVAIASASWRTLMPRVAVPA
jgi:UDP-3-O-[3-hydroxymyristoyl] N-acetylglucosamine deacetylase